MLTYVFLIALSHWFSFMILPATGEVWRLLTNTFLHANIFHLGCNAFALHNVGPFVERSFSQDRFLTVYLLSGLAASVASHYWLGRAIGLGASGSICGLYGAYFAYQWMNSQARPLLREDSLFDV